MRINRVADFLSFNGIRQDRNTVEQLKHDNAYDLNLPNQRRISRAIDELSKVSGEDNVNFLLDVSQNLRYGTNIDLGKKPYNDWKEKLNKAALKSLELSDKSVQEKLTKKVEKIINAHKDISSEERELLAHKELLLEKINIDELKNIKNINEAKLYRNLNYFIISSEVPLAQKTYILKQLNYFMSEDYKINSQLKDKKTQVLAEILNDIVVDTPESKIPNIKAINQRQHGICAAISICRKALAYEDKANYVDMLLTELDEKDFMEVYDRTNLGQHKKVPVPKAKIDYDYAIEKGYRIVDTSAMNWMNVADTSGAFNDVLGEYKAFDKSNFGTFEDTHIHKNITDKSGKYQSYYRSCKKAKDAVAKCKKRAEKQKYYTSVKPAKVMENLETGSMDTRLLQSILKQVSPSLDNDDIRKIMNELTSLNVNTSEQKSKLGEFKQKYTFITNEETELKAQKIQDYLHCVLPQNINEKILNEKSSDIVELIEDIKRISSKNSTSQGAKYNQNKELYNAAAAFRTMQSFALELPECLIPLMIKYNIPDNESYLLGNLNKLSKNLRSRKIDPELREKLLDIFGNDISDKKREDNLSDTDVEILAQVLDEYAETVNLMTGLISENVYKSLLVGGKKNVLLSELTALKDEAQYANKAEIENISINFGIKADKNTLLKTLDKYIEILSDENCTEEQYVDIYNKSGHKSRLIDMKNTFDTVAESLNEQNQTITSAFNLMNGADANSPIETTLELYKILAQSFNNMSIFITTLQDRLLIYSDEGIILNSADPKHAVLKKLENMGNLPTEQELLSLRTKFDRYSNERYNQEGATIKFKDLPKNITTFTPMEKAALNKYRKNINAWYATSLRNLNDIYREMKEPLEELNREIGVQQGTYWVRENESGLVDNQTIKIFEHMTDRHYYFEKDIRAGIDKIKESPYSGSSSTSVMNTEPAMHSQYIADVQPAVLKTDDNQKIKNIIFHDNTWGLSEHDNVWVDKQGFLRTDYLADYGGEEGYITNDKYQNGKLEDNLIDKVGKFVPSKIPSKKLKKLNIEDSEEFTFPLIKGIIIAGVSPQALGTVKEIKQILLTHSDDYLDDLANYASSMTQNEIKSSIKKIETAGRNSQTTYEILLKRIKGDSLFDKGIDNEEKYYQLNASDKLRLIAEKVALIESYEDIPDINTYNIEVKTQKDIDNLRNKLRIEARNNFDYIMAKNPDIIKYAAEKVRKDGYIYLKEFSKDNDLNLNYDTMTKIISSMKRIKKTDYNGSLSQGIDLMIENLESYLKQKTNAPDNKIKELSEKMRSVIQDAVDITESDVKTGFSTGRNKQIADWIDREFCPKSDKEFAQILNSIRNMTTKEFKAKYNSKITDTDLGIKQINGYDIVKMIRSGSESIKNSFINTVFAESYYKDIDESRTRAYYDLEKLSRNLSGGTYIGGKRSFDDIYSDFYKDFQELSIKKEFDKYKDDAFRKYSVFPAYPQVEISTAENLEDSINTLYEKLNDYIDYMYTYKNQQGAWDIIKSLKKYSDKNLNSNSDITERQYSKISQDISRLLALKSQDSTFTDKIDEWAKIQEPGIKDTKEIKDFIDSIYNMIKIYEKTADNKTMEEAEEITRQKIEMYKKIYVMTVFGPEYQSKALELLDKWIAAKSKAIRVKNYFDSYINEDSSQEAIEISNKYDENIEKADEIFEQFKDLFYKHRLLMTPEKYLNEYLLLCAKDAKHPDRKYQSDTEEAKEALETLKESYKHSVQGLLSKSELLELKNILMKCARRGNLNAVCDAFKKSTLQLKDGSVVTMDSEEGLNIAVSQMLNEENLDTAAMFLNQLGLSEPVVKMITDKESLDMAYKNFNRIQSILKSVDTQAKFANDELEKLGDIDNIPDYEEQIKALGERIKEKALKTSFRKGAKIFDKVIELTLEEIKKYPNQSKTVLLNTNIDLGISSLRELTTDNINKLNQHLEAIQTRYNLINKLILPDNSDVISTAQEYIEGLQQLLEYEKEHSRSYPNIGITQES